MDAAVGMAIYTGKLAGDSTGLRITGGSKASE